ncbi:MAG: tetratricopeptide repeat protein [Acidobacteriota bacterium]|nr:tetratricopeptide repeat protein [Acidobacteriota bacterium]
MFIRRAYLLALLFALLPVLLPSQTSHPRDSCSATKIFDQASTLLAQRQYGEAIKSLNSLQTCPQLSELETFQLGWLYGRARQFDTALAIFNKVPQNVPDPLTHAYAIALSKFELADYRGVIQILGPLNVAGRPESKSANLLAVSYSKLGLYRQAYPILARQIDTDPDDLPAYLNLVTVCGEGGDFAKAADVAAQALKRFPNSPDVVIVSGAAESLLGRLDLAYQRFTLAVSLAPSRPDARFFLALMDYDRAKFLDAVAVLRKANRDGIRDSDLHYLMAECLLKIEGPNVAAALSELNQAVQLSPGSVAARTLRGRLLLERNEVAQAVADLELAHHKDPASRSTMYNLARAYRALGKSNQASALFRQLRSGSPDTLKELGDRRLNQTLDGNDTSK